jgi:hypothetical protein
MHAITRHAIENNFLPILVSGPFDLFDLVNLHGYDFCESKDKDEALINSGKYFDSKLMSFDQSEKLCLHPIDPEVDQFFFVAVIVNVVAVVVNVVASVVNVVVND